ncbi:hypothetical protein ACIO7M_32765 [Streptomyces toxytricini]|uniref:Uncharacterized protein n=1 Tax=Streptomyces toxytricini TaxID=67369 RepID=A0ABW8EUS5_STRT5
MKRHHVIATLARAFYNASDELIAERHRVSPAKAADFCRIGQSQLRHPSRARLLNDVLDDSGEGALVIDKGLRDLIRS